MLLLQLLDDHVPLLFHNIHTPQAQQGVHDCSISHSNVALLAWALLFLAFYHGSSVRSLVLNELSPIYLLLLVDRCPLFPLDLGCACALRAVGDAVLLLPLDGSLIEWLL